MKVKKENNTLFLIPETDLIANRIEELRDYFAEQLKEHSDVSHVLLDVNGVDFVDSLGVNLIVGLYRQVTAASQTIEIIGAGENFMKVAAFFRLTSLFPVKSE
ncbi:STAS domain-containing protein [Desulfonema magnum]|uniref:STAS domain-containing protein n=1 Tax=Desulfonema magnum TaxID=45655 RepID=A0A975BMX9_9BACT|nr:STAS domain-containing protein [Desulfonema magnum]QTA88416.1 STAS domain-containing protein [Desulfonema magnum]